MLLSLRVRRASGPAGFESPLHAAVEGEAPEAISALVRHGAEPDWREGGLETPLFGAVRRSLPHVVEALLATGSDLNIHGGEGTLLFTLFSDYSGVRFRAEMMSSCARC